MRWFVRPRPLTLREIGSMRNDNRKWAPLHEGPLSVEGPGATLTSVCPERQTILSGVDVLIAFTSEFGAAVGWPDVTKGESYSIALRRDRVLLINWPAREDGWDVKNRWAVSDMTGGYACFDLSGSHAMDVLKRGTEIALAEPSRSAARLFAGLDVVLYRHEKDDTFRFHVNRAQSDAFVLIVRSFLDQMR